MKRVFDAFKTVTSKVTGSSGTVPPSASGAVNATVESPPSISMAQSFVQTQFNNDPQKVLKFIESESAQKLLSDPQKLKDTLMSHPLGRTLMASNPQVAAMFDNKELMEKALNEVKNNPSKVLSVFENNKATPPPEAEKPKINFEATKKLDPSELLKSAFKPEAAQHIMSSPAVQQLIQNPELLREQIKNNPLLAKLAENDGPLKHLLNNPEALKAAAEKFKQSVPASGTRKIRGK